MKAKLITLVEGEFHEINQMVREETPIICDADMNPLCVIRGKFHAVKVWRVIDDRGGIRVAGYREFGDQEQKHEFAYRDIVLEQHTKYPIGPSDTVDAKQAYKISINHTKVTIPYKMIKEINEVIKENAKEGRFNAVYTFGDSIRYNDRVLAMFHFRRQGFFVDDYNGNDVLQLRW